MLITFSIRLTKCSSNSLGDKRGPIGRQIVDPSNEIIWKIYMNVHMRKSSGDRAWPQCARIGSASGSPAAVSRRTQKTCFKQPFVGHEHDGGLSGPRKVPLLQDEFIPSRRYQLHAYARTPSSGGRLLRLRHCFHRALVRLADDAWSLSGTVDFYPTSTHSSRGHLWVLRDVRDRTAWSQVGWDSDGKWCA